MEEARKEVGEIIDRLAVIYDEEDDVVDRVLMPEPEEGELIDGLGKNADAETKIKKILEDRK